MENYFATLFEDVWHERSLVLLPSIADPNWLKQTGSMNHEEKLCFRKAL